MKPKIKIIDETSIGDKSGIYNAKTKSILRLYGYNVNKKDNLSAEERQSIIAFVLGNGIRSRKNLKNLLEYNKRMHKNNKDAIDKWNEDIKFIRSYSIKNQRNVKLTTARIISRNKYLKNT